MQCLRKSEETIRLATLHLITKNSSPASPTGKWIFLGENFLDILEWEKRLGKADRISYAHLIPEVFSHMREPLMQWTTQEGHRHGKSMAWWLSNVASRNVMATPFFLHICYLEILRRILEKESGEIVVVCEDSFLLRAIAANFQKRGHRCLFPARIKWESWCETISKCGQVVRKLGGSLARQCSRWFEARWRNPRPPSPAGSSSKARILIHTCLDESCLGKDGILKDRYFGRLPKWLEEHGCSVMTIPWLFNAKTPFAELLRWFRSNPDRYLIPEDHWSLSGLIESVGEIVKAGTLPFACREIEGFEIRPLEIRERLEQLGAFQLLGFLLYRSAIRDWIARGNRCQLFLDMFENMPVERPQAQIIREVSPKTPTVGYQHLAAIPEELLGYSLGEIEANSSCFPDYIVSSGPENAKFLMQRGFPHHRIFAGPALRYEYLFQPAFQGESLFHRSSPPTILAVFPLELSGAVELASRLFDLADWLETRNTQVTLRLHPMTDKSELLTLLGVQTLPAGWNWSSEPLLTELRQSNVVLGSGTNALFDAAAAGIPVISLGRESGFSYNPLHAWRRQFPGCRTFPPEELKSRLSLLFASDISGEYLQEIRSLSTELRRSLGSLEDARMNVFLDVMHS